MSSKTIFDYQSYQDFLVDYFSQEKYGKRANFAKTLNCAPSFLTKVLKNEAHFSLEQADVATTYWKMSSIERDYFFNLLQLNRSGTNSLKKYFENRLEEIKEKHFKIKNRLKEPTPISLSLAEEATYYSSWHYSAVHIVVSLPHINTIEEVALILNLNLSRVKEVINFLLKIQLVILENKKLSISKKQIHLDDSSTFLSRHHMNWRNKTIQTLESFSKKNLHYSSVITCSEEDLYKIKDELIKAINIIRAIVRNSKDEKIVHYALDCFEI